MSFVALFGFFLVGTFITIAVSSSRYFLSPACSLRDRATFIWIAFDGLTHVVLEGGFLWYSIQGRTCNNSNALLAQIWQEYAKADARWGNADPDMVAMEFPVVLGGGILALYVLYLLVREDPVRHYWITLLSFLELMGTYTMLAGDWLKGFPSINTSNALAYVLYLWIMTSVWVIADLVLLISSYRAIRSQLRVSYGAAKKASTKSL